MYARHRRAFLDRMADGDLALFPGASLAVRNHDVEYRFRQNSDYLYLSGHREPDGLLLLARGIEGVPESSLFVLPRDPERETWTGRRLGPEGAVERLGVEQAWPAAELAQRLEEFLPRARRLWYRLGDHPRTDRLVGRILSSARNKSRQGVHPPAALLDPVPVLHELRLHKDEDELALMRRAAAVTAEAHLLAMAQAGPGLGEWELEALIDYTFRRHGADGWAYATIVAGGANACVLHYTENGDQLADGALVLIDAGAEFSGYACDVTRSFPVSGRFTPAQRDVYEIVLAAERAAVEKCLPGEPWAGVHEEAVRVLADGLRSLGVLAEPVDEIVEKELYKPWYMHNTSHWLGLDVHDAGTYTLPGGDRRLLAAGM
ncbi:MAG: M24 family metallopeptidase, partial [Planctomycetota bacterium]